MNKTIDAKFFIISPDEKSKERIQKVIYNEICEIYIVENIQNIKPLLLRLDKLILVIDSNTFSDSENLESFILDIINSCGNKLLYLISIDYPGDINHDKILSFKSDYLKSDQNVVNEIDKLDIWGPRSYIRLGHKVSRTAFFRMKINNIWRTGVVHDISASGMSCSFDHHEQININEQTTAIEICIKERIFHLSGTFLIRRTFKNSNMFVLIFSQRKNRENIQNLNSVIYTLTRQYIIDLMENYK
ncbi:MAG: hypothetical protein JEY91_16765 [Spirochaetaceae bacterium]|nr:hypothetical protein [Spirochaetaceae bacterium]